ncbi:NAD(P)-binding protein [Penicillium odoratum]|uniref:NAD(P)-binding protein n=1 Tax=Penicillium odoratum TaxID=1167516 RepID=UPI002549663E|nr:NAD(P)-binding protein [Penicillium odoratum]KAJ5765285.1 NAD(P)-binding protein [Penicillium odoratum]
MAEFLPYRDHKIVLKNHIAELNAGTEAIRDALTAYSLNQPGDPVKVAQVIIEVSRADSL